MSIKILEKKRKFKLKQLEKILDERVADTVEIDLSNFCKRIKPYRVAGGILENLLEAWLLPEKQFVVVELQSAVGDYIRRVKDIDDDVNDVVEDFKKAELIVKLYDGYEYAVAAILP